MQGKCVRWLHIGELHVSDEDGWESIDRLSRIVGEVEDHIQPGALDFVFLPGDNANHGEPEQYDRIAAELEKLGLPVHAIAGDHDFEPGSLTALRRIPGAHADAASVRLGGRRGLFSRHRLGRRRGPGFPARIRPASLAPD